MMSVSYFDNDRDFENIFAGMTITSRRVLTDGDSSKTLNYHRLSHDFELQECRKHCHPRHYISFTFIYGTPPGFMVFIFTSSLLTARSWTETVLKLDDS